MIYYPNIKLLRMTQTPLTITPGQLAKTWVYNHPAYNIYYHVDSVITAKYL